MVEFNAETHEYTEGGVKLPSVTQVLRLAGVLPDYDGKVDPYYAERGTAIHAATEYHDRGTLDEATVDPSIAGYLDGWKAFLSDTGAVIKEVEKRLSVPTMGYAGTIDRVLEINGKLGILDIKGGVKQAWHSIQTAGYAVGYFGSMFRERSRWALYLKDDANYMLVSHDDPRDFGLFTSALGIAKWKRRNGYA